MLALQSPKETSLWKSAPIACNSTSGELGGKIAAFFQGSTRAAGNVQTDYKMYDVNGVETKVSADAKKYVYTITMLKRISGSSFTAY